MELEPHESHVHLIVIILAQLLHRCLDIIVIGALEVVVNLFLFIGIDHLFDEVIDIDLRAAENDRLQLIHHLLHTHTATLRQIVQIHTPVDRLNDLFLACTLLCNRADTHVVGTNDLVLIDIFLDYAQELIAIPFGLRYTYARNGQQLIHRDRVGSRHGLQTRVLEDHKRRHIVLLRYLTADILQDGEQHLIGSGTGRTRTFHIHLVFVMHLNRHLELTRLANELQTVFLQLQVAVRIHIFLDHTDQQSLSQNGM